MRTTWRRVVKTEPLIFLLTVILSFTCLTDNSFGYSESDLQKLLSTKECVGCDLSGADLSGSNLMNINLTGANLRGANLVYTNLARANLTGTNLNHADLWHTDLTGANLTGATLTGVNLTKANLTGTIGIEKLPPSNTPQPSTPQPPKSKNVAIATGTGFLFGSQDYIITNYHVVKGTSEVKVKFTNGESINAEVVARDTQNDVAILKLTKPPSFQSREMKFGDSSMVRMGDKVFTIGYPHTRIMGFKPKYTEGVISAVTGIKDNPTVFQTTVPIQPGNSGGPLFNDKGEVVGLTTSSLSLLAIESMGAIPQSVNYAVKSSFVKNTISTIPEALLSNRGIVVVPTDSNSRSDFIEAISKNVVLILGKVD